MAGWYSPDGLHFSCTQCSHCCRHEPGFVYLSQKDLTNLCLYFNLKEQQFIEQYCRWVPYYDGSEVLCLLEKENNDCIFWDSGCAAYGARPVHFGRLLSRVQKHGSRKQQNVLESIAVNCIQLPK